MWTGLFVPTPREALDQIRPRAEHSSTKGPYRGGEPQNVLLEKTDLHVHLVQSLYPRDVFELGKARYSEIDWSRLGILDRYEQTIGVRLDPVAMLFRENEAGDPDKFGIRSMFPLRVTGYYLDRDQHDRVVKPVLERHRNEGISYIERRNAVGYSDEDKAEWGLAQALHAGAQGCFG